MYHVRDKIESVMYVVMFEKRYGCLNSMGMVDDGVMIVALAWKRTASIWVSSHRDEEVDFKRTGSSEERERYSDSDSCRMKSVAV